MSGHANEARVRAAWESARPADVARLRQAGFISHNVPLTAGECTRPGEPLIAQSPRTVALHDLIRRFGPNPLPGRRAVDLGCLEGGLSFELWRAGLVVTGVEVREDNLQRCWLLRDYYAAGDGMVFLQADVREFRPAQPFDVVVCSGLLYHLDDPAGYIAQLGELTAPGGLLFLDTHVAPEEHELAECSFRPWLSGMRSGVRDGIPLRWREYVEDVTRPESSIGNTVSLWLDAASHVELMLAAGFERVFEPNGYYGTGETLLKRRHARRYWAALKKT